MALVDVYKREGKPPPTILISGGVGIRSYLDNKNVQQIFLNAEKIVIYGENEKDAETQVRTDELRQRLISKIKEVSGNKDISIVMPEFGCKDIAEQNLAQVKMNQTKPKLFFSPQENARLANRFRLPPALETRQGKSGAWWYYDENRSKTGIYMTPDLTKLCWTGEQKLSEERAKQLLAEAARAFGVPLKIEGDAYFVNKIKEVARLCAIEIEGEPKPGKPDPFYKPTQQDLERLQNTEKDSEKKSSQQKMRM